METVLKQHRRLYLAAVLAALILLAGPVKTSYAPRLDAGDAAGGSAASGSARRAAALNAEPAKAAAAAKPADPGNGQPGGESDVSLFPYLDFKPLETVEVTATGYYAGKESTGKTPRHPEYGITYSGVKVRKDKYSTIAADPKVFALGTILYIPGYGYGVVADTGSAIKGRKIDLYYPTKRQIYENWGKKSVKVAVIKRGDGTVTEAMLDRLNASGVKF